MLIHFFVSVPRNDYLNEDMPDDEGIPGMPDDVGIPDFPEEDIPACPIPSQPSRFQSSTGALPTITLSIIHWQSKTWASEPELWPASELHALVEHGQDDVPGFKLCFSGVMPKYIPKHLNTSNYI